MKSVECVTDAGQFMIKTTAIAFAAITAWFAFEQTLAMAGSKAHRGLGSIKACSRYGNGCVAGPVRRAQYGLQVRLKSGTWIDCKGDCGQALLEETIDFWDSQADKARAAIP